MKKIIFSMLIALMFISCTTKSDLEKLQDKAEKEVLLNLDNPKSYEFISFKIDTFSRETSDNRINDLNLLLAKESKNHQNKKAILDLIESTRVFPKDEIEFSLEFRATNKFNALIKSNVIVISDTLYNFKRLSSPEEFGM